MGCFNMKCALTSLPITDGDKVVVLFGVKPSDRDNLRDYAGGYKYQPNYFKLITTPVYGSYNDYGWFECDDAIKGDPLEELSLMTAIQFLDAVGHPTAGYALRGDHWHDVLRNMTNDMFEPPMNPQDEIREVDYTFIHRAAWNKLLEYGRRKSDHLHVMLSNLSDEKRDALIESLNKHGFKKTKIDKNRDVSWLSSNSTYSQVFDLGLELLPTMLIEPKKDPEFVNTAEMSKEDLAKLISAKLDVIESIRSEDENSTSSWLARTNFEWFRPLFSHERGLLFNRKLIKYGEMQAVLSLTKNLVARDILRDCNTIYKSLNENQLVIRAQGDLPSQSQESIYWGSIALHEAVREILLDAAKQRVDYLDDDDPDGDHDGSIEALAKSDLRSWDE